MNQVTNDGIESVRLDTLLPHPSNPRRGVVSDIVESIKVNGWYGRVIVRRSTGHILAGNHRFKALKAISQIYASATPAELTIQGWPEQPPCPLHEIPVQWVKCDDATALRILLVDNRASDLADYDDATLYTILDELSEQPDGLDGTLYTREDYEDLRLFLEQEMEAPDDFGDGGNGELDASDLVQARFKVICPLEVEEQVLQAVRTAVQAFDGIEVQKC